LADDLTQQHIQQRDPEEAIRELHDVIIAANTCMQVLASMYPACTFVAGADRGQPVGVLVYATSNESCHLTFEAMANAQRLAKIVASLPDDLLQDAFRIELNTAAEVRRLRAEEASAAALSE
jgi:hypothetical protein